MGRFTGSIFWSYLGDRILSRQKRNLARKFIDQHLGYMQRFGLKNSVKRITGHDYNMTIKVIGGNVQCAIEVVEGILEGFVSKLVAQLYQQTTGSNFDFKRVVTPPFGVKSGINDLYTITDCIYSESIRNPNSGVTVSVLRSAHQLPYRSIGNHPQPIKRGSSIIGSVVTPTSHVMISSGETYDTVIDKAYVLVNGVLNTTLTIGPNNGGMAYGVASDNGLKVYTYHLHNTKFEIEEDGISVGSYLIPSNFYPKSLWVADDDVREAIFTYYEYNATPRISLSYRADFIPLTESYTFTLINTHEESGASTDNPMLGSASKSKVIVSDLHSFSCVQQGSGTLWFNFLWQKIATEHTEESSSQAKTRLNEYFFHTFKDSDGTYVNVTEEHNLSHSGNGTLTRTRIDHDEWRDGQTGSCHLQIKDDMTIAGAETVTASGTHTVSFKGDNGKIYFSHTNNFSGTKSAVTDILSEKIPNDTVIDNGLTTYNYSFSGLMTLERLTKDMDVLYYTIWDYSGTRTVDSDNASIFTYSTNERKHFIQTKNTLTGKVITKLLYTEVETDTSMPWQSIIGGITASYEVTSDTTTTTGNTSSTIGTGFTRTNTIIYVGSYP